MGYFFTFLFQAALFGGSCFGIGYILGQFKERQDWNRYVHERRWRHSVR